MLRQYTECNVADNSGAKKVEIIQQLGKVPKRGAVIGDIVVASVKVAVPQGQVKKKEVVRAVIVRQKAPLKRADGTTIRFDDNAVVIINPDRSLRGTRIIGPVAKELRDLGYSKLVSMAAEVL